MKSQTPNLLNSSPVGLIEGRSKPWRAYSTASIVAFSEAGIGSEDSTAWLFAGFSLGRLGYVRRAPRIVTASEARNAA
jgi:hypothetical protein